jgi:two-component system, NtrC family, response regulator AtoC
VCTHSVNNEVTEKLFMASAPTQALARSSANDRLNPMPPDDVLFGKSSAMQEIWNRAVKVCKANIPVLLCGEGGTGKEALGRWIHANSACADGAFVKVNCAAIPGTLLESELFGYEKGAFTGAHQSKPGRVEVADQGTLFLDEIADLSPGLQSKVLHFLQDGSFCRLGAQVGRTVNARLICATNKDLEAEMAVGRFREDLFYRINVVRFRVPSLRDRRMDIPILAEFFREHHARQFGKAAEPFPAGMLEYLQNLNWPGNVRELSNGIARYVLIGAEAAVAFEPAKKSGIPANERLMGAEGLQLKHLAKNAIREMERNVILEALREHQWNRRKTAQALKISYRSLIYKIHDAGLVSRKAPPSTRSTPTAH